MRPWRQREVAGRETGGQHSLPPTYSEAVWSEGFHSSSRDFTWELALCGFPGLLSQTWWVGAQGSVFMCPAGQAAAS